MTVNGVNDDVTTEKIAANMPRGRKVIGPPEELLKPPDQRGDSDDLVDAAFQGYMRDARVQAHGEIDSIVKPFRRPEGTRSRRKPADLGKRVDATNRPKDPRTRSRPRDHSLSLLVQAVALLMSERRCTRYAALRHVVERLLAPPRTELAIRALDIPPHALTGLSGDARFAAARKWIMNRVKQACR